MAFTAQGMLDRYKTKLNAILTAQTADAGVALTYGDAALLALFQSITDEIHANARCSGSDSGTYGGDTHDNVQIV